MSESPSANVLTEMLERMPGVVFCSKMDPATRKSRWVYFNARATELYDVLEPALRADPDVMLERILAEDRGRLDSMLTHSIRTGAPMTWVGRLRRRNGDVRWIETQATIHRDAEGFLVWSGQTLDVTERKQLEVALAASEDARSKADALHSTVIDALPVGVTVMNPAGEFLVYNAAQRKMNGQGLETYGGDMRSTFGVFRVDGVTPFPNEEMPLVRALHGEESSEAEMVLRNAVLPEGARLLVTARPLRDANGTIYAALAVSQDVTTQRLLEVELRSRNEELAQSEAAKANLIERLRFSIDELSNPILEVWDDVLAMPIIGVVDSRRTADMVHRLLGEVSRTQASFVIIDLTGVEVVDTKTADHLMKLMRKVEVVGARCVLTGIRPAVAETLVDIGVDFGRLVTLRNLKHGLREALRFARQERDGGNVFDLDDDSAEEAKRKRRAS
ncbi:RsbR, positive regulator of sigma-B [Minicystis rosea]|nr:RsbR, positive regulator of sigma-B [Minicystis rosea]